MAADRSLQLSARPGQGLSSRAAMAEGSFHACTMAAVSLAAPMKKAPYEFLHKHLYNKSPSNPQKN